MNRKDYNITENELRYLLFFELKPVLKIAEHYGCSHYIVTKKIKEFGIILDKQYKKLIWAQINHNKNTGVKRTDEQKQKISDGVKRYFSNLSDDEYAEICNRAKISANSYDHSIRIEKFKTTMENKSPEEKEITRQRHHNARAGKSDEENHLIARKGIETKKKNKSFSRSNLEREYYEYLISIYGEDDVVEQYSDDRYPFNCDFYIKSIDKFIEIQGYWTHGPSPFDKNNIEHLKLLEYWKSKNTPQYEAAIDVWTVRDPHKVAVAQTNDLNIEFIYPVKGRIVYGNNN